MQKTDSESSPDSSRLDLEYLNDKKRNRRLVRKLDLRIMPLCASIYLLNYVSLLLNLYRVLPKYGCLYSETMSRLHQTSGLPDTGLEY